MSSKKPTHEAVSQYLNLKHRTAKAVLVSDGTKDCWLPLSQVHVVVRDSLVGPLTDVYVPRWIAQKSEAPWERVFLEE